MGKVCYGPHVWETLKECGKNSTSGERGEQRVNPAETQLSSQGARGKGRGGKGGNLSRERKPPGQVAVRAGGEGGTGRGTRSPKTGKIVGWDAQAGFRGSSKREG